MEPVDVQLPPDAFEGQLPQPQLHFEAVERLEPELRDLWTAVAGYAQGIDEVNVGDAGLLQVARRPARPGCWDVPGKRPSPQPENLARFRDAPCGRRGQSGRGARLRGRAAC